MNHPTWTTHSSDATWQANRKLDRWTGQLIKLVCGLCTLVSIITTIGIVATLIFETIEFFRQVSLWQFLTDTQWTPLFTNARFGIFVLISATVMTSTIALCVALPIGLLSAICLSEYASPELRRWLKPALEVLAGVPSVVYGYFALLFVTPLLQQFIPGLEAFNALSAGLVMGIAVTPLVASLSEDAIYAVPQSLRQGAYALGATKRETIVKIVLPAALSGIVAASILAISRAIGETMIVTLAAGQNPRLTLDPRVPVATMTAFIAQVSLGDTPVTSLAYKTMFAVGMTLFLMTLTLNIVSFWFVRRFRMIYE
ncbi:phosphate ABC transporter membrane protein 1, PhoT family (plasmid) [Gloeocapsa sp. PCC 7428]|uniref:phosphate ABC transporter permease subunit PstC n=1 Tax=Gloeocapsa sp. PCC 7428 TaxID=1173026 RepID=UPI0002A61BC6|nr:phosphate ABC transporter permease subunit PstC [Gloeocapsa sp. PCC 7428]AFZ33388.1 phosphate ABC transporter membrane protein 1, PhoT family [Gloeocapsa sp. PCC 7428]